MLFSLYISFTKYDNLSKPVLIGLRNYIHMANDWKFWNSLKVTFIYAVCSIVLGLILSFFLALLLNQKFKGIKVFRAIYYIPVVIPSVAAAIVWQDLYNVKYGIFNQALKYLGLKPFPFLTSPRTALFSLLIFSLWGVGGSMLIWLAGFNGVPVSLYEAADIDGAGRLRKLFNITIPMVSPVIFYNLVMGVIANLQTFTQSFVMTDGGPLESTNFLVLRIYRLGFRNLDMGYASAQAWALFVIILMLTFIIFKTSSWVFYGDEGV